jgi:hypothetical protein
MSDQGGASEAGWQPDPHGRHEYRYWDGNAWTDQVSDGGVVSTDPPGDLSGTDTVATPITAVGASGPPTGGPPTGPPTAGVPAYVPPGGDGDKPKRKVPVGILALIGLAVAGVVAALVIFLGGGDDGGGGTGSFSGTISDDEPFAVRTFDLDAGEALRIKVEPDSDLDAAVTLGVDTDLAQTELFGSRGDNLDDLLSDFSFGYDELFSDTLDGDVSSDLSSALSDDFTDFRDQLVDSVPSLEDAGVPLFTLNTNEDEGDDEGILFLAPLEGTYSLIISGRGTEGDFDATIETADPDGDFEDFDADEEIDLQKYYEAIDPQRDFLCDEDFWGGDPQDVSSDAEQICDDDAFSELLSGDFSADFSDDFSDDFTSDFSDDFSDSSSDFSDDFSDLFTDDFSDDFSDDVTDEDQGSISVGDSASGTVDVGTRDTYSIEGNGQQVTIEVIGSNDTGGLDPTVTVLDSSGTEVGFNDDGNPSDIGDSLLEVPLESGETYTIAVAGFGSTEGDYQINVS